MKKFTRALILPLLIFGIHTNSKAQCVTISNLPDTIIACKNTTVQLDATINSTGLLVTTDTTWTPPGGLSDPTIINPVATIATTSTMYTLTVQALTPSNFVANGDFSGGNTGFTSAYDVGTGGPWGILSNEGTYAVTTDPNLTHTNFASFGDHTTGTGQMLVVNGSAVANTSIWCQTITVQPNTLYDFSAWATSAVNSNPAILQFSINGNLMGTPFALSGATGAWQQFHTTWFSGTSTSATICITNQNTAPSGNDFVIDDIEFREFCTASDSVYIKVVNLVPDIDTTIRFGCESDTVHFTAINTADTADQYIWDFGDGNGSTDKDPTHIYQTQGTYNVKLITRKDGCSDSVSVTLSTVHVLTIDFTMSDDSICLGQDINFNSTAGATLPLTYYWDFGDGTIDSVQSPAHTYTEPGTYTVMHVVHDEVPCYDTIYKEVYVAEVPAAALILSDSLLCEGQALRVNAVMDDGYSDFTIDFGNGAVFRGMEQMDYGYDTSGNNQITLFVDYPLCPDITVTRNVEVFPLPVVNLGPDTTMCPNRESLLLTNSWYRLGDSYLWSTGDTSAFLNVRHPGIYFVTVTTPAGCSTSDSIEVFRNCYIDIPNSFTPNGDGINDYFLPRQHLSRGLNDYKMTIFNRWGQIVFETAKSDGRGWDGKFNGEDQPSGVYVYMIEARFQDGVAEKYQGNVTLLR